MRLSTRIVLLGVSGPLIGLLTFWVIASGTSLRLGLKAGTQINALLNAQNERALRVATKLLQQEARHVSAILAHDTNAILPAARRLKVAPNGDIYLNEQQISRQQFNDYLRQYFLPFIEDQPTQRAGLFRELRPGQWERVGTIDAQGNIIDQHTLVNPQVVRELQRQVMRSDGSISNQTTLTRFQNQWRISKFSVLNLTDPSNTLVLDVNLSTNLNAHLLQDTADLFPARDYRIALFQETATRELVCTYASPNRDGCDKIQRLIQKSGGFPNQARQQSLIQIRRLEEANTTDTHFFDRPYHQLRHDSLFLASFPEWHLIFAVAVEDAYFEDAMRGLESLNREILKNLSLATLGIMALVGTGAYLFGRSITRELKQLAIAADAIAAGQTLQELPYQGKDSLGRLVNAFNRMSGAVAAREASLQRQIDELVININPNELSCQVSEITQDESFSSLSARAREMRLRRSRAQTGGERPAAD